MDAFVDIDIAELELLIEQQGISAETSPYSGENPYKPEPFLSHSNVNVYTNNFDVFEEVWLDTLLAPEEQGELKDNAPVFAVEDRWAADGFDDMEHIFDNNEPCDLSGDSEPCGTPPGPDAPPIIDVVETTGTINPQFDVSSWSYSNLGSSLWLVAGAGWSVTIDVSEPVVSEEGNPVEDEEESEHNRRCRQLAQYRVDILEGGLAGTSDISPGSSVPEVVILGWFATFNAVGNLALNIHSFADGCGDLGDWIE